MKNLDLEQFRKDIWRDLDKAITDIQGCLHLPEIARQRACERIEQAMKELGA